MASDPILWLQVPPPALLRINMSNMKSKENKIHLFKIGDKVIYRGLFCGGINNNHVGVIIICGDSLYEVLWEKNKKKLLVGEDSIELYHEINKGETSNV